MPTSPRLFIVILASVLLPLATVRAEEAGGSMPQMRMPAAHTDAASETAFARENDAAMTDMMQAMAAKPTGDVDRDFVTMMVAHHRGAIAMAQSLLRVSRNAKLRAIAENIVRNQQEEIAAMRAAVGEPTADR